MKPWTLKRITGHIRWYKARCASVSRTRPRAAQVPIPATCMSDLSTVLLKGSVLGPQRFFYLDDDDQSRQLLNLEKGWWRSCRYEHCLSQISSNGCSNSSRPWCSSSQALLESVLTGGVFCRDGGAPANMKFVYHRFHQMAARPSYSSSQGFLESVLTGGVIRLE